MAKRFVLEFCKRDIETLSADVCVSTVHRTKNMAMGPLASHIHKECGEEVQQTLSQVNGEKDLNHGQVAMTGPGQKSGQFKKLLFVCLYTWQIGNDAVLSTSVRECLQIATDNNFTSIAFPALGMGGLKYPPFKVAMALLPAINHFFYQVSSTTLKKVYIVLFDPNASSMKTFLQTSIAYIKESEMLQDGEGPKVTLNGKEQDCSQFSMDQIASAFLRPRNRVATISYDVQASDSLTARARGVAEQLNIDNFLSGLGKA